MVKSLSVNILKDWQQKYALLTEFITGHPEVNIGKSSVRIPKETRPDFYKLFDSVRMAFLRETFPDFAGDTAILMENYTEVKEDVAKLLELKGITASSPLGEFLQSPPEELIRGLFNTLFDLLQDKIDITEFEKMASQDIKSSFEKLFLSGYEKWMVLSLMKMLDADKLFRINLKKLTLTDIWKRGLTVIEPVPIPQESSHLKFNGYNTEDTFITPDAIFHSVSLNKYVSFRSEIGVSLATASNESEKREWYPVDAVAPLESGLTLIYLADKPEEISLVADIKKICRPDVIIACRVQKDWYEKEALEKIESRHLKLKPKMGTYIVSKGPVPVDKNEGLLEGINFLSVGFAKSGLEAIINALSKCEKSCV